METKYRIIRPGQPDAVCNVDLPKQPGYCRLREIIEPLLDNNNMEHVNVWADFKGGQKFEALDMFVDDMGLLKGLPRNEVATTLYRRANQLGMTQAPKAADPEMLNGIVGTAILFNRRVWF